MRIIFQKKSCSHLRAKWKNRNRFELTRLLPKVRPIARGVCDTRAAIYPRATKISNREPEQARQKANKQALVSKFASVTSAAAQLKFLA